MASNPDVRITWSTLETSCSVYPCSLIRESSVSNFVYLARFTTLNTQGTYYTSASSPNLFTIHFTAYFPMFHLISLLSIFSCFFQPSSVHSWFFIVNTLAATLRSHISLSTPREYFYYSKHLMTK